MGVRLPAEYQEVEYLESTGVQWINTGIYTNPTTQIHAKLYTISENNVSWFGTNTNNNGKIIFNAYSRNRIEYCYGNTSYTPLVAYIVDKIADIWLPQNGKLIVNNSQFALPGTLSVASTTPILLFGRSGGNTHVIGRVYSFEIYSNGDRILDFIPCYRKADDKPGMYDLVSGTFFVNQGTGEFEVGPDVIDSISPLMVAWRRALMMQKPARLPAEYREVEYLWTTNSEAYATIPQALNYMTLYIAIAYNESIIASSGFCGVPGRGELGIKNNKLVHWNGLSLVSPPNNTPVSPNTIIHITATSLAINSGFNLFCYRSYSYKFTGRIYYFYAESNGEKIVDLLPCVRKADGVPGFFDLVNSAFFPSVTNTPFNIPQ